MRNQLVPCPFRMLLPKISCLSKAAIIVRFLPEGDWAMLIGVIECWRTGVLGEGTHHSTASIFQHFNLLILPSYSSRRSVHSAAVGSRCSWPCQTAVGDARENAPARLR